MERLSLLFRAQIIAGSNAQLTVGSTKYKRVCDTALIQLQEAVDQALQDYAEMMKK